MAVGRKMEGEGGRSRSGIFWDMNFGRNIWMKALKVGLNQICYLRAARQQVCSQQRVCSGLCLRCSWGVTHPIFLNLHAPMDARSVVQTCLTLLLWCQQHLWLWLLCRYHWQRGWSPGVQVLSWGRGRTGSSPAHQPVVLCLEGLAGIWAPTVQKAMHSLPAKLQPDEIPIQRAGVGERNCSHFTERAFLALRFSWCQENAVAQQGGAPRALHAQFWLVWHPGFLCWTGLSEMAASLHPTWLYWTEGTPKDVTGSNIAGIGGYSAPGSPLAAKIRILASRRRSIPVLGCLCPHLVVEWTKGCLWSMPPP